MSMRSEGQIERLLWAAAEAHRLRAEPVKVAPGPAHRSAALVVRAEQFTTEWQTPHPVEPANGGR